MVTQIGYKASELGMIPHDWEVVELGDVGKTYGGLSGKNKSDFDKGNSFYVPFTNVMANLEVDKNQLGKVEVNEKQNAVLEGDLLFNGSSETPEEVCFASLVNFSLPNLFLNSFCFGFRLIKNTVHPKYLAYWFRSEIGRKTIAFMSQGSTRYNVSKSEFVKLKLVIPSKLEQTAIATALSDTDALISSLQTLITKKQAIKLSAMQNLLSGKIRLPEFAQRPDGSPKTTRQTELGLLPEDWKVVELREIGYFQSGVEFPLYRMRLFLQK